MTERLPDEQPDWALAEAAVEHARAGVEDGYQLGTISVAYDSDYWAVGAVWIKGTCSEHEGELMMRASHPLHLRHLALAVVRDVCPRYGHQQDYDALVRESMPEYPEDEG